MAGEKGIDVGSERALAALCVAAAGSVWAATAPVALVMQVTGTTDPPLARHREVAEGSIVLGPQASFRSCTMCRARS